MSLPHQPEPDNVPTLLVVLVHGLQGTPEDLDSIVQRIQLTAQQHGNAVLIHVPSANKGKTKDGIENGGNRIAQDVIRIVQENQSLQEISFIGFSLGGLYSRYAIALLYDSATRLIAGLKPRKFITMATPHLGVRYFGAFSFIPSFMMGMLPIFLGTTGPEVFLNDKGRPSNLSLLEEMTLDHDNMPYIDALKAFEHRYLYGNIHSDLLVPYGTATLKPHIRGLKHNPHPIPDQANIIDTSYDELGCRIWYRHSHPILPDPVEIAITTMEVGEGDGIVAIEIEDEEGHMLEFSNHGFGSSDTTKNSNKHMSQEEKLHMESIQNMSKRLASIGWTVIGVDFNINFPIAHNRIVAMPRGPIHRWMNKGGARVVRHVVETLLE